MLLPYQSATLAILKSLLSMMPQYTQLKFNKQLFV